MTTIAFAAAACPELFELLRALLAEISEVYLHDLLNEVVHFGFVLHYFSDVDYFLSLEEIEKVPQVVHDLFLVLRGADFVCALVWLALRLLRCRQFLLLESRELLESLLVLLVSDINVLAQLINQD